MTDRGRPSIAVPATEDMFLSGGGSRPRLCCDTAYFRTWDGILKSFQMLSNVIGVICVARSPWTLVGGSIFYNIIGLTGLGITFLLLTLHLFRIVERCGSIDWLYYEFLYCTLWAVLLVISSSIAVASAFPASRVAGIFGYLACLAYGADSYLKLTAARAGARHGDSAPSMAL